MADIPKPLPVADPESRPFWEGCNERRLLAQRCRECGHWRWPPRGVCPDCYSWETDWQPLSGRGKVYTYVVAHRTFHPGFAEEVPYIIAHVTLDETEDRVTIVSNLVDCPWEEVKVGMPVEVFFEKETEEVTLPKFRPI